MAIIEVVVPQLSESVAEATLLSWNKKIGDAVNRDENLIDIETDKVVLEVPAPQAGVLVEVLQSDGATVVAGQVLARIDTAATAGAPVAQSVPTKATVAVQPAPVVAQAVDQSGKVALPAAAKMMTENNLSPSQIQASGKGGRITKGDVINTLEKPATSPAPVASQSVPVAKPVSLLPEVKAPLDPSTLIEGRPEQRVPMSRLRARVAERLVQSQQTNAILTTFNEVNMKPVMDLRNKYKDKFEKEHSVKLGFMGFFVKAAVAALKKYPILNASVDGSDIVYHGYFDIGIAVGSPRGLVVPVIRNADQMSVADIELKIAEYGQKAKDGKLSLDELTGGTFSISNGGVFGSMLSTPIINPPQSAILGIHATKERPVVENGEIVIRPINYLAMSYDHRIIDGREAVLGLVAMKDALEDPARLLLDL